MPNFKATTIDPHAKASEMPEHASPSPTAQNLAETVGFDLLGPHLGPDLDAAIQEALDAGATFPTPGDPTAVFRAALAASIRDIETHPRGQLLQRFLRDGPYEDGGEIPPELAPHRLTDEEAAAAVRFVFSSMVSSFKGALAELLACRPVARLASDLQALGHLPETTRLFVGDAVKAPASRTGQFVQAADFHLLSGACGPTETGPVDLLGVGEVKSYALSQRRLRHQLRRHLERAAHGLRLPSTTIPAESVRIAEGEPQSPLQISILPARWKLPRRVELQTVDGHEILSAAAVEPPSEEDQVRPLGDAQWHITLRWSVEALASAAYEVTFWYMEKVGEVLYRGGVPDEWSEMTPAEAGRNAVKMMLYYAILRARTRPEDERAIALYNTYGFGYALGTSFRDPQGRRQMLWPDDLREVLDHGASREGYRFRG